MKSRHLPEVKSQVECDYYLGCLTFLTMLFCGLAGLWNYYWYITAAYKAQCERGNVSAGLVFTVSVLGWTAHKMWEEYGIFEQTEAYPFFLSPRLDSEKPLPAERAAWSSWDGGTHIYLCMERERERHTHNDIYVSTQTLPNKIWPWWCHWMLATMKVAKDNNV